MLFPLADFRCSLCMWWKVAWNQEGCVCVWIKAEKGAGVVNRPVESDHFDLKQEQQTDPKSEVINSAEWKAKVNVKGKEVDQQWKQLMHEQKMLIKSRKIEPNWTLSGLPVWRCHTARWARGSEQGANLSLKISLLVDLYVNNNNQKRKQKKKSFNCVYVQRTINTVSWFSFS